MTHDDLKQFELMVDTLDRARDQLDDLTERMKKKHDGSRVHLLRTAAMSLASGERHIKDAMK